MARESDESTKQTLTVPASAKGERLDRFLGSFEALKLSRTKVQKLIESGHVKVNGEPATAKFRLAGDEVVTIVVPPEPSPHIVAEDIPLEIVYEDDHLVVVNKPAGMVTHPAAGHRSGTLVNALLHRFQQLATGAGGVRPGIVHRLDKDTSGLLVVARTDTVYAALQQLIKKRKIERTYLALVCGHMKDDEGAIDLPVGRSMKNRKRMSVTDVDSREAQTYYRLMKRYRSYDLLDAKLGTGRTHQIRVHFSHLGHPVFGDQEYGGREKWHRGMFGPERPLARRLLELLRRQALHARKLEFDHPVTGERLTFEVAPPRDLESVLVLLDAEGV